ncbi:MAG: prepilin-type N-terminal cleavage/methylation domain-containing protein [Candidatus Omnitrophica bacterium]|nr:prepilin-type N-terminal cleavage/methylation domain-containing protein [Candidatus Omnitrophota bacterium]
MQNQKGFTLVEILVSSVIFALLIVGLLSVFVSGTKNIIHARERMTGSELGRFFMDPLGNFVRQDTWDSNALDISATPVSLPSQTINNRIFSATYKVADSTTDTALSGTNLRRVTTTIIWTESTL